MTIYKLLVKGLQVRWSHGTRLSAGSEALLLALCRNMDASFRGCLGLPKVVISISRGEGLGSETGLLL